MAPKRHSSIDMPVLYGNFAELRDQLQRLREGRRDRWRRRVALRTAPPGPAEPAGGDQA